MQTSATCSPTDGARPSSPPPIPRASLVTIPAEITSRIVELACEGARISEVRAIALVSRKLAIATRPHFWKVANLGAVSISDLFRLLMQQFAESGRLVEAVLLGDTPPSSQRDQIPASIESINGLRPSRRRAPPTQWRIVLLSAILPLLPNLTRLSFDVAMVEHSWNLAPLLKAIGETHVQELVLIQAGVRRQVHEGDFWIVSELIELLPLLRKLTLRITQPNRFYPDNRVNDNFPSFRKAMGSLKHLESLAIIGAFHLFRVDGYSDERDALSELDCPLQELVVACGFPPETEPLLRYLARFEKTLRYVRVDEYDEWDGIWRAWETVWSWCQRRGIRLLQNYKKKKYLVFLFRPAPFPLQPSQAGGSST